MPRQDKKCIVLVTFRGGIPAISLTVRSARSADIIQERLKFGHDKKRADVRVVTLARETLGIVGIVQHVGDHTNVQLDEISVSLEDVGTVGLYVDQQS
jgi:hypothetical protein